MLSIDAARAAGFRDSLYFFRRNPLLHKLNCGPVEKDQLIAEGKLHANLKSRQVTMITAHNTFKIMGARFVESECVCLDSSRLYSSRRDIRVDGKHIIDDYYEDLVIAQGKRPGDSAYVETYDPDIDSATLAQPKHGGAVGSGGGPVMKAAVKTPLLPTGVTDAHTVFGSSGANPFKNYDPNNTKSRRPKAGLTQLNWMSEYAHGIASANKDISVWRQMRGSNITLGNEPEGEDEAGDSVAEEETTVAATTAAAAVDQLKAGSNGDVEMASPGGAAAGTVVVKQQRKRPRPRLVGIYEPHTNLPHVRLDFEPTRATFERVSNLPDIPLLPEAEEEEEEMDPEDGGGEEAVKRRKLEVARAGASIGLASVVYVMETTPEGRDVDTFTTVPGIWDFRSAVTA
jgi:hypothetical protein